MRLWLIGSGIAASPSPAMHNAALRACGVEGRYSLRDVNAASLPGLVAELRRGEARGTNVTIPFKVTLAGHCDVLEGDGFLLGAVNTITVERGRLVGDNTDARGLELALEAEGLRPSAGCHALVLGAGGAAAAVALALTRVRARHITVAARRPWAVCSWRERLAAAGAPVAVVGWSAPELAPVLSGVDIIVNATPVGLSGLPFRMEQVPPSCSLVDLRYRPRPLDLVAAARAAGHRACDGMEMLLQQGMLSFTRWTGCQPPWAEARAALQVAVGE